MRRTHSGCPHIRENYVITLFSLGDPRNEFVPIRPPWRHIIWVVALDVAGPAQRPDPLQVVGISTSSKRWFVVRLQTAGAAAVPAPPPVALECRLPRARPSAAVKSVVVPAHQEANAKRTARRCGRSNAASARPHAITVDESRSIRPRDVALSMPGLPLPSLRSVDLEIAVDSANDSDIINRFWITRR